MPSCATSGSAKTDSISVAIANPGDLSHAFLQANEIGAKPDFNGISISRSTYPFVSHPYSVFNKRKKKYN